MPGVYIGREYRMSEELKNRFEDTDAAQQRFLSLFLQSEREIYRYVASLVPNTTDAKDIVQQTAMELWKKFELYDQPSLLPLGLPICLEQGPQMDGAAPTVASLAGQGLAEELSQRRQELQPEFERRLKHLESCLDKLLPGQRSLVEAYYYERADIESLSERSGRTAAASYKMLQRIRHTLQLCVESHAKPEVV